MHQFWRTRLQVALAVWLHCPSGIYQFGEAKEEPPVLWITYFFFSLASLSCAQMTLAFSGVIANRGLSRGVFNASAIMSVVYTVLTVASGQLVR